MRKNKKDDIVLLKFKILYGYIFYDPIYGSLIQNHFNKNSGFAAFILALAENQIGKVKLEKHTSINSKEWIRLFRDLYDDLSVIDAYKTLSLNPIIPLEEIKKSFDCFDKIIKKVLDYFKVEQFNRTLDDDAIKNILKTGLGFLLYNSIECKMKYSFEDILSDPLYDMKVTMITNNTRLFSEAKNAIIETCRSKINDLITMLLGASKDLNFDK